MNSSDIKPGLTRWAIKSCINFLLLIFLQFTIAGRVDWWLGWVYVGLYAVSQVINAMVLLPRSPDLLAERSGAGAGVKGWDYPLAILVGYGALLIAIGAGLQVRYEGLPPWQPLALVCALIVAILGSLLTTWAMASNRFFSGLVRIQNDRDHQVASNGPYRFVRHPGYVGALLFFLAAPLVLWSLWAYIPSGVVILVLIIRTALEDRTLRAELSGYKEYAEQVRYRLLPGIW